MSSVVIDGNRYKRGYGVITGVHEQTHYPTFQTIKEIFVQNSVVLFGLIEHETIQFSPHYHSWITQSLGNKNIVQFDQLISRQCLLPRQLPQASENYNFFTLKHSID